MTTPTLDLKRVLTDPFALPIFDYVKSANQAMEDPMSVTTTAPHITVDVDRSTWGEREYRMALTIWAEPGDSTLGSWI